MTTTYFYDFLDRVMRYVQGGGTYAHFVNYGYDTVNNLTSITEQIDSLVYTTAYTYDDDNRVTSVTRGHNNKHYTYDAFGRVSQLLTKHSSYFLKRDSFTFYAPSGSGGASSQIASHSIDTAGYDKTTTYTYDNNGNILTANDGVYTISYAYDSANQLIRENNPVTGKTTAWTYDSAGNIKTRTEYAYTAGTLGTPTDTVQYTYGNSSWGDLLTAYDGIAISYDGIGNPLNDGTRSYTWKHGRQLATVTAGGSTWTNTYNADGLRTKRTNGSLTYNYVYNGDKLTYMTVDGNQMYITYDANGTPMGIRWNHADYYYVTNIQGDVIAITTWDGQPVVEYTYDAWGNVISTTGSMADTIGKYNPFRYRGYVYDPEYGLYYLQSRYYNPEIGRFLNSDIYPATGQGLLGNNMFAYCNNNPVVHKDSQGTAFETVFDVASLILSAIEVAVNPTDLGAWIGLLGDTIDLIPFVTGVGESIRIYRASGKIADGADAAIDTYRNLRKVNKGKGVEVHHILEKRFVDETQNTNDMLSIALPKDEHLEYTNKWRVLGYGSKHEWDAIIKTGAEIYADNPRLMAAFLLTLENLK